MAVTARKLSLADYLALDAEADRCLEYRGGEVVAMAGAEPEHNRIKDNIAHALGHELAERGCWVMPADQRVPVGRSEYVYPDVAKTGPDESFRTTGWHRDV